MTLHNVMRLSHVHSPSVIGNTKTVCGYLLKSSTRLYRRQSSKPWKHLVILFEIKTITKDCKQCTAEPTLQPLTEVLKDRCANTEDARRVDVRCIGLWNADQDAFHTTVVIPIYTSLDMYTILTAIVQDFH